LAFATLIAREANQSRPLLPLDLLRSASFRNSILASVLCFVGQTAGLIALPFYLQAGLGLSPSIVGLYLTVWPLSVAGTAFVAGRLSRWANSSTLCVLGGVLLALGMFAVAIWPPGNRIVLTPFLVASGIGFGLFQVANNRNMFLAAPMTRSGAAGGMQGTARLLGQAGGAALVAQLFTVFPLAFAEELLFRGVIFQRLLSAVGEWPAQIAIGLLFVLTHLGNPGMDGATKTLACVNIFLASILFGKAFLRSKGLALPIGLHFMANVTQGVVFGFGVSGNDTASLFVPQFAIDKPWLTGGAFGLEASAAGLITLSLMLACFVFSAPARTATNR
jgi:membrane protease YdiL (CAAX protease family)